MRTKDRFLTPLEIVMERVFVAPSGCWEWIASTASGGYGQLRYKGSNKMMAHKVAYESVYGLTPEGLELDHLCRNRRCCNPTHLEAVTHIENSRRGDVGKHLASRTHCPHGHEYTEANTYRHPRGERQCRACRSAAEKRRKPRPYKPRRAKACQS